MDLQRVLFSLLATIMRKLFTNFLLAIIDPPTPYFIKALDLFSFAF